MNAMVVLAVALSVGQTSRPELVTLPLSGSGDDAQGALSAWNAVVGVLDARARKMGVSTRIQKTKHEFLVGPAREQAADCSRDVDCLAEIGATLGADILVVGVAARRFSLMAIRVADRTVLAKVRSPAKGAPPKRARLSAKRLARALEKALKGKGKRQARATRPSPGRPNATPPPPPVTGLLYIHRDQLSGISRLTLDGEPVSFTGEGFVSWPASSGEHTLRAFHVDGRELSLSVFLEPGRTTEVPLTFPTLAPVAPPPPPVIAVANEADRPAPAEEDDDGVLSKWWFWTAVGSAVIVGTVTAAALVSGSQGGPTPPSETGTIQGSY